MNTTATATLSHYRLIELLGRGGMGEVWLAEDIKLPRQVAIKLLPRHLAEDREAVERLLREAQAAASVDHPAVVTVYEAGLAEGRPYIVMQRLEGETLEQRLKRGPLQVEEAVELGRQLADALAEVHAVGVVHRDLKASNILLTTRGPRILDFGIASLRGASRLTSAGTMLGTPVSMSPEQVQALPVDNRADLWALGTILYEALTGQAPFTGESLETFTYQIVHTTPQPPSVLRREVPRELDAVVLKLLRKNPAHRYARAEELIADLDNVHAASSGAPPAVPRVAVLPFEVLSADPDDAFLAAGLVDDLIVDLTRLRGVRVASRAEVLPYRDRAVPVRTLARELGADALVLGSVRRAGNRARIAAQLVRAHDGQALWADRFDRTLDDLFEVQAEVSRRIVGALEISLRPDERQILSQAPTRSAEAYGLYLKGRELLDGGRDENQRAEVLLERAIGLDPDFALAHAAYGQCLAIRAFRWWSNVDVVERALPHARRALELVPDLLEALIVLMMVHRIRGESEQLVAMLERVTAVDADQPQVMEWAGFSYLSLGQPDKAAAVLERVAARHPDYFRAAAFLASAYDMLGRMEDAERASARAREGALNRLQRHPEDADCRTQLAISLARGADKAAGVAQAELAVAMASNDGRVRYNAACALALAGEVERALAHLRAGVGTVSAYLTDWPARDPDLASLHGHPEFIAMFGKAKPA